MPDRRADGPAVVTGGAGAIGLFVVERLLADGREVRVVDNFSTGRRELLPSAPKLTVLEADLGTAEAPAAAFRGAEEVWHLAANANIQKGTADPRTDLANGALATFHVLEQARRQDVRRVLFSSSSVVYGRPSVFPTPESYGPLEPESLYGGAKLAAEGLVSAYAHSYGLTAYIFRFANIVDGRMNHGILHDFFEKLRADPSRLHVLGDGRQAKSYLRTEDCVGGMAVVARRASAPVNIYNLGAPDRTSVREIAEKVVAAHGGTATITYGGGERGWVGDVPQQLLAIEKVRALGWTPSCSSNEAIDRTIAELVERRRGLPRRG
ncbi:MAG TPA: NAD-dependent epimerase/dehydratase family protein [Thermoplasmata archaeon]|nr:NAD-dependent epimerase/dehydratase family protein [Thermoplasmata archaeon]